MAGDTAPAIRAAVGAGSAFGLDVTYIRQEAPLGLAHAVLVAREYPGGDGFVMYLGGNFIVGGITSLAGEFRRDRPDAQSMLTEVPPAARLQLWCRTCGAPPQRTQELLTEQAAVARLWVAFRDLGRRTGLVVCHQRSQRSSIHHCRSYQERTCRIWRSLSTN